MFELFLLAMIENPDDISPANAAINAKPVCLTITSLIPVVIRLLCVRKDERKNSYLYPKLR